jgi:hypothetical protein
MRIRIGMALVLSFAWLGPTAASAQSRRCHDPSSACSGNILRLAGNGAWWASLSDDAKADFIDGYTTAMSRVNGLINGERIIAAQELKPGAEFNARMDQVLRLSTIAQAFDFRVDGRGFVGGIDEFYKDPLNTRIPIDFAMLYVRDELRGDKSPKELQDELAAWREVMNN